MAPLPPLVPIKPQVPQPPPLLPSQQRRAAQPQSPPWGQPPPGYWRIHPACADSCREEGECAYNGASCVITDQGCAMSDKCRVEGRCIARRSGCAASSEEACRASVDCRARGRCYYQSNKHVCYDGMERSSTGMMVTGIVMSGIGALGVLVGAVAVLSGDLSNEDGAMVGGGVAIAVGATVALIGVPLAIAGGSKEKRRQYSLLPNAVVVGPGSMWLSWQL